MRVKYSGGFIMKKISLSLEREFYRLVCKYADLFRVPNSEMMQLLLSAGISAYENNSYKIVSSKAAHEDKEMLNKYQRLLYIAEGKSKRASEKRVANLQKKKDTIEDALVEQSQIVSKRIIRPKMNITESYYEFIKDVIVKEKAKGYQYTYSDVIYTFIRHSLYKELDVLRYAGYWGEDAREIFFEIQKKEDDEKEDVKKREVILNLPAILYFGMFVCAKKKGINVQTYIKAVLYDNFVANKDLIVNEWKNGILPNTKSETAQSK